MTTRAQVVAEAREWIGTPWVHQAYRKGLATDCLGLIGGVPLALGMAGAREWADDPTFHCYGRTPEPRLMMRGCNRFMDPVPLHLVDLADVLIMAFEKEPQHFAIVSALNPMYVVHAYSSVGKVTENGVAMFRVKVLRAFRYRGLTE